MKRLSAVSFCVLIAVLLLLVAPASAATRTWDGSSSINWNTAANWVENAVPANGDDVILTGAGNHPTEQNIGNRNLLTLTFNSSTTAPFTLGSTAGNRIRLTSTGTALTVASGAAGHTISCPMQLGATTQTWQQDSANPFTVSGVLGQSAVGNGFTKTGTGTLIFTATDTYTGMTTVSAGTLQLGDGTKTGLIIPATNLITDNSTLIYNTPSTITHSGVISGTGTFNKSGTGTLTLSGTDTYTGATTVYAGTLSLGDGAKTGVIIPTANSITDNSTLIYNTPSTITHSGVISGTGTFTKSGTGTLTLSGGNLYTGATTVSAGTLSLGDGTTTGNIIPAANLITDTTALIYNTPSAITHSGVISGTGTFTKSGTGTLTLSGGNLYTGATTVSAGTLSLGDGTTTGNIIPAANLITDTTALIYNTPSTITHSGVISGAGTFTKSGTGTLTLSGTDTYTGVTTVSAGTLSLGDGAKTGVIIPAANLITDSSALIYNTPSTITHSGVISGTGTFNKSGTGALTLSGTDTYTGATTVYAGTLSLGDGAKTGVIIPAANLITDSSALIYNTPSTITHSGVISGAGTFTKSGAGTLTLNGTNLYTGVTTVSAGTLSLGDGTATGNIIPAANLITDTTALIYNTPSTITHSGVISGAGTFTKSGTGTLILSGANTYTGATTVSAGELQFNGVNTGTSAKTVSGGTLAGTGTIPGTVTVANVAGSALRGGTGSGTSGTLTITSGLTFSGTSSSLNVTSNGASLSLVSVGTNTITEGSGMTVNLLDTMQKGNYTLISKTSAGLPTTLPTLGTNLCGKIPVFTWATGYGLNVSLYPVPTVTGISPVAGPIAGGTSVIITGTGFTGAGSTSAVTAVKFGSTAASSFTVTNDTSITATSPAGSAGTVDVTVTTPGGTTATSSADQFTYGPPPAFTSITPNTGVTTGGTSVIIRGTNLTGTTGVTFGGTAATNISVINATAVSAITPSNGTAGAVNVVITTPYGTATGTNAFTYFAPSVNITLNEGSITLALVAESSATDSSLVINTTTNVPFAITVADGTGRSSNQGYMGSYTSGAYDSAGPDLGSPLQLLGTTTGSTTAQPITPPLLSTTQTLYSGSAAVTNQNLPTLFTQPAAYSDPHLPGVSTYRIDLSFIIQTV